MGWQAMTTWTEVLADRPDRLQEALCLFQRFEPPHRPFPLTGRLM